MQEFVELANRLADEAGEIVKQYYRQPFEVISKDDESPVTIADRSIEERLREIIESERPEDGIFGEEFGIKDSQNGYSWVIDPIDGTKSFVIGRPTFGTLIALCKDDVPIIGIIDQAILKERWIGVEGKPTMFNSAPVKTRPCPEISEAAVSSTTPAMFKDNVVYEEFEKNCKLMTWGADCYAYGLLANGFIDIVIEDSLSPYDFAALVPVVKGAGGHITDWKGEELTLASEGKVIALGDPSLWDDVEKLLD